MALEHGGVPGVVAKLYSLSWVVVTQGLNSEEFVKLYIYGFCTFLSACYFSRLQKICF